MTRSQIARLALLMVLPLTLGVGGAGAPKARTLSEQELVDMLVGSSILCTRGGDTEGMIQRIKAALGGGKRFTMIALEDVPDEWTAFTMFGVGGGGAWDYVTSRMEAHGFAPEQLHRQEVRRDVRGRSRRRDRECPDDGAADEHPDYRRVSVRPLPP